MITDVTTTMYLIQLNNDVSFLRWEKLFALLLDAPEPLKQKANRSYDAHVLVSSQEDMKIDGPFQSQTWKD